MRRLLESGEPWFAAAEALLVGVVVAVLVNLLVRIPARRLLRDDDRARHIALMAFWGVVAIFGLVAVLRLFGSETADAGMATTGTRVLASVPDLVVALVVLVLGFILATAARAWLRSVLSRTDPDRATVVASVVGGVIMALAVLLAGRQVGVQTGLLDAAVLLLLAGALLAAAIAVGTGLRDLAAAYAARRHTGTVLHVGDEISVAGLRGTVVAMRGTSVRIRLEEGGAAEVPNATVLREVVVIHETSQPVEPPPRPRADVPPPEGPPPDAPSAEETPSGAAPGASQQVDDQAATRTLVVEPPAAPPDDEHAGGGPDVDDDAPTRVFDRPPDEGDQPPGGGVDTS